jgi:hypothetical protein
MHQSVVIEWAPFTLAEGVEEAKLLAASASLQDAFLSKQPGFIRRELLKGADRQWVDVVVWESRETADQAVKSASNSPVCYQYFQLMADADHAEPGAGVVYFERMAAYEQQPR